MTSPFLLNTFTTLGITLAAVHSGFISGISITVIPPLAKHVPAPAGVKVWRGIYDHGKVFAVPAVVVASSCFAYVAYAHASLGSGSALVPKIVNSYGYSKALLFAVAAAADFGTMLFTLMVMERTSNKRLTKLKEKVVGLDTQEKQNEQLNEKEEKEAREQLTLWGQQNAFRSLFPLIGAATALWACL